MYGNDTKNCSACKINGMRAVSKGKGLSINLIDGHIDFNQWEFYVMWTTRISFLLVLSAVPPFLNPFPSGTARSLSQHMLYASPSKLNKKPLRLCIYVSFYTCKLFPLLLCNASFTVKVWKTLLSETGVRGTALPRIVLRQVTSEIKPFL